jgi:hypothetical protein
MTLPDRITALVIMIAAATRLLNRLCTPPVETDSGVAANVRLSTYLLSRLRRFTLITTCRCQGHK